ncbi:MAG TPA: AarF/UbiB family protein, partial [Patescibacteria group bacterium]|nr:AarF/UbiB family protein [Patescibacteria group bacterium]
MLRFIHISGIILKYAFLTLLLKLHLVRTPPNKLIKGFFEEAGGSFIKFGQLLALRVDILPKEYSLDMFDLLDNVKPFSYDDVKEIFLDDLGAVPERIFKDFQKEPFASGSFGQVHAAKLEDDTIVAVKIMRPGIDEMVQADFLVVSVV